MNLRPLLLLPFYLPFLTGCGPGAAPPDTELSLPLEPEAVRSPFDLAVEPETGRLAVSDRTAGRLYLDPAPGEVLREVALQGSPRGVAWRNGSTLAVAEYDAGTVAEVNADTGRVIRRIPVGPKPVGVAYQGNRLAVAEYGQGQLWILNADTGTPLFSVQLAPQPFFCAYHPRGREVAVAHLIPEVAATRTDAAALISFVDPLRGEVLQEVRLPYGSSNVRKLTFSPDGRWLYVLHTLGRTSLPTTQLDRGWINTNALSILDVDEHRMEATLLLDKVTLGAADPWGLALSPGGDTAWISLAGAHEVARIDLARLHTLLAGEGDPGKATPFSGSAAAIWNDIAEDPARKKDLSFHLSALFGAGLMTRHPVDTSGPRALALRGGSLVLAGYYAGELLHLDPDTLEVQDRIPLGDQPEPTLARVGERLFHDGRLSFQKWVSCASCHPDGRADGMNWDLLNDGIGNPKNAKSLLLTAHTPPAMSRGVRPRVKDAIFAGLTHFQKHDGTPEELAALHAYLAEMEAEPSPYLIDGERSEAALRGKAVFENREVGCAACHNGPYFTSLQMFDVGTRSPQDADGRYDTPTLVEIWRSAPYLHDGRASTLHSLFTEHNPDDRHGRTSQLSSRDLDDLLAYIRTL